MTPPSVLPIMVADTTIAAVTTSDSTMVTAR